MLTRLGYEVISIESPLEAYKLFSEKPARFDLRAHHIICPW